MGHDERFKLLLQEFIREFFELFLPELVDQLDFTRVQWMQQEMLTGPPEGTRRTVDLLARIPVLGGTEEKVVHIHIEVESDDTVEPLRRRMYEYFHHLTHVVDLAVLPIAVYLRVGLEGRGVDRYTVEILGRRPLLFEYDYIGLPALPGADFLARRNVLGVALSALMRWPREDRVEAALAALEALASSTEEPRRKVLLCDVVNVYAPLDEAQQVELSSLWPQENRRAIMAFGKTWLEQGIEKGVVTGQREMLLRLLEKQFGALSETAKQRLDNWPADRLTELGIALLDAESLRELGLEE